MRHAEVEYYADPARPVAATAVAITARGVEQARAAGRALAAIQFDRVITSGLPRTDQTALAVVQQLSNAPRDPVFETWPELQEIRHGPLEDFPTDQLADAFLRPFRGRPPMDATYCGGEAVGSLLTRVSAAMERLYDDDSWHTILIVAHGGTNRAILSWVLTGGAAFFGHFEQSFACINIIDGDPAHLIVRATNHVPRDPVHASTRASTVELILEQYLDYRAAAKAAS